ncbi:pectinesterase [Clostridium tertium]|uniref:pectinesterase n=1 Tax=Clostridium tertium TaxID=1559 RepID=UPI0020282CF8|nr:pectinesterase [Clostridium tertium]
MNSLNNEILTFIKKASKRIRANFIINLSIVGLKYLLCLILCLLLISLFITFPYVEEVSLSVLALGLISIIIYGFIKAPGKKSVALIVDLKGLNERVTTSLELINEEDNISIAQKKDTVSFIKNFRIKDNLKITVDKKQIFMVLGLIIMCFMTSFIDTSAKKEANSIREFNKYQQEFIKKIEEEKKLVEKSEELTEEEKEAIKKILEDAKKELKESEKKLDVNKTLERMEKKLEDKKNEAKNDKSKSAIEKTQKNLLDEFNKDKEEGAKKDLNKLTNELMKKKEGKEIADAILSKDKEKLEKALGYLKKSLGNMSSSELNNLSKALANAANSVSDENLSEALSEASNSVLDGKLDAESLKEAIQNSQNNSSGKKPGDKEGEGEGEGEGQGQGEGEGQGEGNGSGSGSGNGSGNGSGTGWNMGSNEGTENDLENKGGEQIYIPGREVGNDENLTGNKNQEGNSQTIETENGFNLDGNKINYDKVIGDYTNSALEGANNSNLPESLKDLIKDYFEGLN